MDTESTARMASASATAANAEANGHDRSPKHREVVANKVASELLETTERRPGELHGDAQRKLETRQQQEREIEKGEKKKNAEETFAPMQKLEGHRGAVYALAFAPNGRLLASGGFDRSVRCWSAETGEQVLSLTEHTHNVSDLAWSADSSRLISGGFDQTVRLWDTSRGAAVGSWSPPERAFVLSVAFAHRAGNEFVAATAGGVICHFDTRCSDAPVTVLTNGAAVNSITLLDDYTIYSGDKQGAVKCWDLRSGVGQLRVLVGDSARPISHMALSQPMAASVEDGAGVVGIDGTQRILAVNSFDDTLSVFAGAAAGDEGELSPRHRLSPSLSPTNGSSGSAASVSSILTVPEIGRESSLDDGYVSSHVTSNAAAAALGPAAAGTRTVKFQQPASRQPSGGGDSSGDSDAVRTDGHFVCLHKLRGHKIRGWPVKSSIFVGRGRDARPRRQQEREKEEARRRADDSGDDGGDTREPRVRRRRTKEDSDEDEEERDGEKRSRSQGARSSLKDGALLVATGSTDARVHIYDISGGAGTGSLLQRLEGHTDRVYSTSFHPTDPVLATGGADFSIRMWSAHLSSDRHNGSSRIMQSREPPRMLGARDKRLVAPSPHKVG